MVAHLVRLRLLVLWNSLRRSPWQMVAVILGALYGLGMLALAAAGLVALSAASPDLARTIVVLAGSAVVLGWVIIPLFAAGMDQTLDPAKLVTFPIPLNSLFVGLLVSGVLGIPGVLTLLGALATAGTWWQHPFAALIAVVCAFVGMLTCVVASRMVASISTGLASGRRFREISGIIAFVPLVLLGPIIVFVSSGLRDSSDALPGLAEALSWTPLGAIWSVPADVVLGNGGAAALKFVIALATLALCAWIWRASLSRSQVSPMQSASRKQVQGKLGFFGRLPATPTGAVAARALTYWLRDPRYARQFIIVPLIPVLMLFYANNMQSLGFLNATAPLVALLMSLSIFTDVAYDNTAFALHVSKGVSGVADRAGRVIALGSIALPAVLVLAVATVWISDAWSILPGLLGLTLGVLFSGLGLASVSSSLIVVPVPAPGDSPFKSPPGGGFTTGLMMFAAWGILLVLVIPELALAIIGFTTGQVLFGWIALVVGVVLGAGLLVAGIRVGGARLDRSAAELLARLTRQA
ncbi:hypothetical protein [Glaciibacter superstes]|uniref:hypothetical protein n=1 Tax=Glaciibacter superstes TaxID=501023 RepID=UPI00047C859F|nr:hypothetical protein [Glaciibacter superstes]